MKPRPTMALIVAVLLLQVFGCSDQKITKPEDPAIHSGIADQDESVTPVVNLADLQGGAQGSVAGSFANLANLANLPDVAITDFTGTRTVYPGETLSLSVTLANVGDLAAVGPFDAWLGVLGTGFVAARRTLPGLAAGDSRSAVVTFTVPAKALAAAVPPGDYTLYCTHDFPDSFPANDYLLLDVELRSITPPDYLLIPAGTFTMGSPTAELGRDSDETQHQVTLTHGFFMQTTEVTNLQYTQMAQWAFDHGCVTATSSRLFDNLDGSNTELLYMDLPLNHIHFLDGVFTCDYPDYTVKNVTWFGAAAYCDWLSLQQGLPRAYDHATWQCHAGDPYSAAGYRLPTEAEWEYACRAGSPTAFANGPITNLSCYPLDANLDLMGWYCGNSGDWIHPAAQKLPNAFGLYDMHGNMWEWCNDWYAPYGGDATDPVGPATGSTRGMRGGSWIFASQDCRSASRNTLGPTVCVHNLGFRSARSAD